MSTDIFRNFSTKSCKYGTLAASAEISMPNRSGFCLTKSVVKNIIRSTARGTFIMGIARSYPDETARRKGDEPVLRHRIHARGDRNFR